MSTGSTPLVGTTSAVPRRAVQSGHDARLRVGVRAHNSIPAFNSMEVSLALNKFNGLTARPTLDEQEIKELEKLLRGKARGKANDIKQAYYSLGEMAKLISDSANDTEKVKARLRIFDTLINEYHAQNIHFKDLPLYDFVDKCILTRLKGEERSRVYNVFGEHESTAIRELQVAFFKGFSCCVRMLSQPDGGGMQQMSKELEELEEILLGKAQDNSERAFYLLKNVLPKFYRVVNGEKVIDRLCEAWHRNSPFKDQPFRESVHAQILGDNEKLKGFLRKHGSILMVDSSQNS